MQFEYHNDPENIPEQRLSSAFQSTTLGLRSRINQNLRPSSNVNTSAATRTFGLQSRILTSNGNLKFGQGTDEVKRNMSVISSAPGMMSEDMCSGVQNNERLYELRRNECSVNGSYMSRPFGLQRRNLTSLSHAASEDHLRSNDHLELMSYRRNNRNVSSVSRMFDLRSEKLGGLNSHDNETLSHDMRKNNYVNSSLMLRPEGFSSRNAMVNSGLPSGAGLRLNEDSMYRNNGVSVSKSFRPIASSSTLAAALPTQDSEKYSENMIDGGGFKVPLISRVIRGRNSTLSSRLFHRENIDRHCKDLSNINGFNESHISQRNFDTLSGSRFATGIRNNYADNQSISHSISSTVKSQVLNLLENMHYSLLKIGPQFRAEAVRLVFEKAKQNVKDMSEAGGANSICNGDAASVISQPSKNIGFTFCQTTVSNTLDGGSLRLKSGKEILQSLIMNKEDRNKSKTKNNSSIQKRGKGAGPRLSLREAEDDSDSVGREVENLSLVFKSPKAGHKKKKRPQVRTVGAKRHVDSSISKAESKVISLKQWYPIAVGSNLAFCGIDEEGTAVKTDAVKKRLNSRKVELMNGLACHLIGSPSKMVSVLPEKIVSLLKNGLTERWRVFQKELLNCQTAENNSQKRKSRSPQKVTSSPKKKTVQTLRAKAFKGKVQNHKSKSTPVDEDGNGLKTRSGRTIKPPKMYWLVPVPSTESDEVTNSSAHEKEESSSKKCRNYVHETPMKSLKKVINETPKRNVKASRVISPGKKKNRTEESSPERIKTKSPEANVNKKKDREEEVLVDSSTVYTKRQTKKQTTSKRKREITEDTDAVLPKKSKLGVRTEVEIREISETSAKGKKEKSGVSSRKQSQRFKGKKPSPPKKKKTPSKKETGISASESKKEKKETKERREISVCEDDFDLNLDDIEIPEIGNVSRNTHLSRSQLRLESMETPPLKYFTNNLKILGSATPVQSPDWCISQRTESEVKQFQRRREKAFGKKTKVDVKKTVITEKSSKSYQNRDVKRVMEWVSEKTVKSPQWTSKVLQYIIPSRKRMEQQADEEEDEDIETEFL